MAIDNPLDQAELVLNNEQRQSDPVLGRLLKFSLAIKQVFEAGGHVTSGQSIEAVAKVVDGVKDLSDAFADDNTAYLLQVVKDDLRWLLANYAKLSQSHQEFLSRDWLSLFVDADRKARQTRARERVERLGQVLVNAALSDPPPKAEVVEEMLRIAMNLDNIDVRVLAEAIKVQSRLITRDKHPSLHESIQAWKNANWDGFNKDERILATEKLQSLTLLHGLESPNNINSLAPMAGAYLLTRRGLEFVRFLERPEASSLANSLTE